MNLYQTTMYRELMQLCAANEAFTFKDFEMDECNFRIFNYRLASYTDFLEPSALECRGHMFQLDSEGNPIRLASLPDPKFFNYMENPFTMDVNLDDVVEISDKADGSLITTYTIEKKLYVKTKGSLTSDQAIAATAYLELTENSNFAHELLGAENLDYTVIMEWVSPENRIVLGYENARLIVLGVRSREDGSYVNFDEVDADVFPTILSHWTARYPVENSKEMLESVPEMKGNIEGFVARLPHMKLKFKTMKYLALHHTKDSINTPRRLYEAVIEEATDDMRTMFFDDPLALKLIAEMEVFVEEKYNHLVDVVERFYELNKDMERKDYAILGQKGLSKLEFGLVMQLFVGREIDFKVVMKKRWKHYGLKDEKVEVE